MWDGGRTTYRLGKRLFNSSRRREGFSTEGAITGSFGGIKEKDEKRRKARPRESLCLRVSSRKSCPFNLTLPRIPHLPSSPPSTWTINSPSMLWTCVRRTDGNKNTEGELESVCACVRVRCVQKQGGADSCGLWAIRCFCAHAGLREEEQHPPAPATPPHQTTWTACPVCTQQTRQAANPAGDQQLSTTPRGLQAEKTTRTRTGVKIDAEADASRSIAATPRPVYIRRKKTKQNKDTATDEGSSA